MFICHSLGGVVVKSVRPILTGCDDVLMSSAGSMS